MKSKFDKIIMKLNSLFEYHLHTNFVKKIERISRTKSVGIR